MDLNHHEAALCLQRLSKSGIVAIACLATDGTITDANGAFLNMLGASEEELLRGSMRWKPPLREQLKDQESTHPGAFEVNKDLLQATLDSSLEMIQVFKAVRDADHNIVDFIWVLNNARAEAYYGQVVGQSLLTNNPSVIPEGIFKKFVEVVETGIPQQYKKYYSYEQFNGWFHQSVVKLNDGVATSTLDVTERKAAEQQLAASNANNKLEIFKATLSTQEEERKRISENLHNGLGQILYGIKISLEKLNADIACSSTEKYEANKAYTEELLNEAINETRRISHELTPAVLEDFGLVTAVKDICRQFAARLKFTCSFQGLNKRLDKYVELAAFRIVQELMINVIKHARATTANVDVKLSTDMIILAVSDNGIGFSIDAQVHNGIGLASIRSRAELLNGCLKLISKPGDTKIIVEIPLP